MKMIIDTDPGIDDAMAIYYALLDPKIDLIGLTTIFGNVYVEQASRNAIHLLELFGAQIPVATGEATPLSITPNKPSHFVHGDEGLGTMPAPNIAGAPIDLSAAEFICEQINQYPNEITLCPIGPLTNIAKALELDPSITSKVKDTYIMGGSFKAGGNVTNWAEANIWNDPHAADLVFASDLPVTMVGLDVTLKAVCTREDFQGLQKSAPKLGGFLNEIAQFYIDFYEERSGLQGCNLHDPATIIAAAYPEFFSIENHKVTVKLDGDEIGATIAASDDRKPIAIAMDMDAQGVRNRFLDILKSGF